ncbi:ribonuclease H family protein [Pseudoalteromonas umbrosa]|uniref:ribonuclease H family protein n=1 Tax=Pseudoalteromonas umbrosa TaxID=3048489 RepID=UPI0024C3E58B|nr:ribonuclease H family protein [Pseudoalteromonas sp. B95]MDK1286810.1 ribonuclease H family protein [Pseudoalteromonas sp. B95]
MAKKYYVVWKGRETGIFTTWTQCKSLVDGFAGARYKSFPSLAEAEAAFGKKSNLQGEKSTASKGAKAPKPAPVTQAQIDTMPYEFKIFTDGACDPNPGEAGTGLAIYQSNQLAELWYGFYQPVGTNNTAELRGLKQALVVALGYLEQGHTVGIFCDSKYAIDCITKWAIGWQKKGWTKSDGEIKNLDIIQPTFEIYQKIATKVKIHHVNGHVGIEGNELADRMSIVAIERQCETLHQFEGIDNIDSILALRAG